MNRYLEIYGAPAPGEPGRWDINYIKVWVIYSSKKSLEKKPVSPGGTGGMTFAHFQKCLMKNHYKNIHLATLLYTPRLQKTGIII